MKIFILFLKFTTSRRFYYACIKIRGTSLANPERFSQAAQLIEKAHFEEQAAGVLSAPAKLPTILSPFLKKPV